MKPRSVLLLGTSLSLLLCAAEPCHAAAPASPADMMGGPLGPKAPGSSMPVGMGGFMGGPSSFAACGGATGPMGSFSGGALKEGEVPHPEGLVEFHVEFIRSGSIGRAIPGRGSVMIPLPPEFPHASFRLCLKKTENGFIYYASGLDRLASTGAPELLASGTATPEDARELCGLLNSLGTARLDGWHRTDSALGCDFRLRVRYAGGETIDASGRGGAAVLPPSAWNPDAYLGFFSRLAESQGKGFRIPRADAAGTGPLTGLVVRFTLAEPRNGMPAGSHDYQLFRGSQGLRYSLTYSRGNDVFAHISGTASQEDMDAAKAMLSAQDCWKLAGLGSGFGHFGGGDSYALAARFESGPPLESGGGGASIPADWHEEPWFGFFMKLAESHGEKDLRARLFPEAPDASGR